MPLMFCRNRHLPLLLLLLLVTNVVFASSPPGSDSVSVKVNAWISLLKSKDFLIRTKAVLDFPNLPYSRQSWEQTVLSRLKDRDPFVRKSVAFMVGEKQLYPLQSVHALVPLLKDTAEEVAFMTAAAMAKFREASIDTLLSVAEKNAPPYGTAGCEPVSRSGMMAVLALRTMGDTVVSYLDKYKRLPPHFLDMIILDIPVTRHNLERITGAVNACSARYGHDSVTAWNDKFEAMHYLNTTFGKNVVSAFGAREARKIFDRVNFDYEKYGSLEPAYYGGGNGFKTTTVSWKSNDSTVLIRVNKHHYQHILNTDFYNYYRNVNPQTIGNDFRSFLSQHLPGGDTPANILTTQFRTLAADYGNFDKDRKTDDAITFYLAGLLGAKDTGINKLAFSICNERNLVYKNQLIQHLILNAGRYPNREYLFRQFRYFLLQSDKSSDLCAEALTRYHSGDIDQFIERRKKNLVFDMVSHYRGVIDGNLLSLFKSFGDEALDKALKLKNTAQQFNLAIHFIPKQERAAAYRDVLKARLDSTGYRYEVSREAYMAATFIPQYFETFHPYFTKALEDDYESRPYLLSVLACFGSHARSFIPELTPLVSSQNMRIRYLALKTAFNLLLDNNGTSTFIDPDIVVMHGFEKCLVKDVFYSPHCTSRRPTVFYRQDAGFVNSTTQTLHVKDTFAVRYLLRYCSDKDPKVRAQAIYTLGLADSLTPEIFDALYAALNDPLADIRYQAVAGLINLGCPDPGFRNYAYYYLHEKNIREHFSAELFNLNEEYQPCVREKGSSMSPENAMAGFPWPPSKASVKGALDLAGANIPKNLSEVYSRLKQALNKADYQDFRLFSIKDGFVLVTPVERILPDGSIDLKNRWSRNKLIPTSAITYFNSLLFGTEGHFRNMMFVVSPLLNIKDIGKTILNAAGADNLFSEGGGILDPDTGSLPFSGKYVNVLIYEYYKKNGGPVNLVDAGQAIPFQAQLNNLQLAKYLNQ